MSLSVMNNTSEIAHMNASVLKELNALSLTIQKVKTDSTSIDKSLFVSLQQEKSVVADINTRLQQLTASVNQSLTIEMTYFRQEFSRNTTTLQTQLAQYIESGESINFSGLKSPLLKHLVILSFVCPSVRLIVRKSVPLTSKVQYLKFGWSYSAQTWTLRSFKGCLHFPCITCPLDGAGQMWN